MLRWSGTVARVRLPAFVAVFILLAATAAAQEPAAGTTVSGVVRDSIAGEPVAGATVQLLGTNTMASFIRTARSDSRGRFSIGGVPDGRFVLGFLHPLLESLGLEPPAREVQVDGGRPVRADLAIPSAARLRRVICPAAPAPDSSAAVVGVVRDARSHMPIADVTVAAQWLELAVNRAGFARRVQRVAATTAENGWFSLCNIPAAGTIFLTASRGADSTDVIEEMIPEHGLLRRELYLGPSTTVATGNPASGSDTRGRSGVLRTGEGRLTGTVVDLAQRNPFAGVRVGIPDGPQAVTDEKGQWTLENVPTGTRMLEVRAVGFYPVRRAVDVVAGAAPIHTELSSMRAVLDTVRVTASRINDPHSAGFAERRQLGMGRFVTAEDIARRDPLEVSDIFHLIPGMYLDRTPDAGTAISMRGLFKRRCPPAVYIDGHHMRGLSADDINAFVDPDQVAGIEIYAAGMVPPQFDPGMSGCGSVVIWSRPSPNPRDPRPWKIRLVPVIGAAALGLVLAALLGG